MSSILIVEDEKEIRANLVALFKEESFNVYSAKDGMDGSIQAFKFLSDIILSDIKMPKADGYYLIRCLKCFPETKSIPFIFISASAELLEFRNDPQFDADDYILKPIKIAEILKTVNNHLQKKNNKDKRCKKEIIINS